MDKKVKVVSLVSQRVILTVPELRLRRVWERKGATMVIPFEQLEEAMYSPGVENLFRNGILGIDDMEVKIALGLEPEGAEAPVNIITLNDAQRKRFADSFHSRANGCRHGPHGRKPRQQYRKPYQTYQPGCIDPRRLPAQR